MIVVALDGPSGSGKSSTSKSIAIRAGWNYSTPARCIVQLLFYLYR
jgi:cytidylate kinase